MAYISAAMDRRWTGPGLRWLVAATLVLLLGAQLAQSAHLHPDHVLAQDCLQCQVQGGQAMAVTDASTPPCLPVANASYTDLTAIPAVTFYRPAARGPPSHSS